LTVDSLRTLLLHLVRVAAGLAVLAGVTALLLPAVQGQLPDAWRNTLAAMALIFIGTAFIMLQALVRPRPLQFVQRLMVVTAFVLWGVAMLLPAGPLTTGMNDLVVVLFVVDLAIVIRHEMHGGRGEAL
jgi:hypothetical protein